MKYLESLAVGFIITMILVSIILIGVCCKSVNGPETYWLAILRTIRISNFSDWNSSLFN